MTITSVGFKGTVGQSEDALRWARMGPRFTVGGPTELLVSAAAGDRTVQVSAGTAQACAVLATSAAVATVPLPVNSSGQTRYDLIVMRFLWTDPVTDPVFTYVLGIPGAGVPNVAGLTQIPGTQYDGVLAVVRVASGQGALSGNDLHREAMWLSPSGQLMVSSMAERPTVGRSSGLRITPADRPTVEYAWNGSNCWVQDGLPAQAGVGAPAGSYVSEQSDTVTVAINTSGNGSFTLPLPFAFSDRPVYADLSVGDGDGTDPPVTVTPFNALHTASALVGFVRLESGVRAPNGRTVRINYRARGYNN